MTASQDKRPNIEEVAAVMGPKLLIYVDKMRIKEESLTQMCNSYKKQIEKQEFRSEFSDFPSKKKRQNYRTFRGRSEGGES